MKESSRRLSGLRLGIRALLSSVPGGATIRTSVDLERWLGVNKKIAWQLFRFNQAGECLADARHLPTEGPFQRFIEAAKQNGADKDIAEAVVDRYREVENFIAAECGSRVNFESMMAAVDRNALADVTARHKRMMHESASHLWGIRAAARFSLWIVFPSKVDSDYLDVIHFDGLIGLHCQRNTRAWPVTSVAIVGPEGETSGLAGRELFDDEALALVGAPIIRRFSSNPLPEFELADMPGAERSQVLARFNDLGISASMDLTFGYIARRVSVKYRELNKVSNDSGFGTAVRVPCGHLSSDFLIHESVRFLDPSVHIFSLDSDLSTHALHLSKTTRLPIEEQIEEVGTGSTFIAGNEHIPMYPDLIDLGLDRTELASETFRAYRCQIEHPIVSTLVTISFPMPSRADVAG